MLRIRKPIKDVWHITTKHRGLASWYKGGRHKGIDLRTRCEEHPSGVGTHIYAVADGVWEKVMKDFRMGNTVILRHGDYQSVYGHLDTTNYIEGYTDVKAGDCIGYSGKSGTICFGSHLHFEIRKNGVSLDPLIFIKNGEDLVKWAKARAVMRIGDKGQIKFLIKGGIVEIDKDNCWNVISKNCWGISEKDYKDLLTLL